MMKKILYGIIAGMVFVIAVVLPAALYSAAKQTNETELAVEEYPEPTPLVIETEQEDSPMGVYYGTVTIAGSGIEGVCYEGLILIGTDGERVRITCTDAVRSRFVDVF